MGFTALLNVHIFGTFSLLVVECFTLVKNEPVTKRKKVYQK